MFDNIGPCLWDARYGCVTVGLIQHPSLYNNTCTVDAVRMLYCTYGLLISMINKHNYIYSSLSELAMTFLPEC